MVNRCSTGSNTSFAPESFGKDARRLLRLNILKPKTTSKNTQYLAVLKVDVNSEVTYQNIFVLEKIQKQGDKARQIGPVTMLRYPR